jgi:pimeloyl-ACP methyl ester carboxylesterase
MTVLLLHAFPLDERMWHAQVASLADTAATPVTPRLYGRGPSLDGWAAQLLAEVDGPFVAVGASMGGSCALALARRAPERILGLVLVGSRAAADSEERRAFRDGFVASLREDPPQEMLEASGASGEELAQAMEAMRDREDLTGALRAFGGPVLLCVGDQDELLSVEDARALAGEALLGSLEVFAGAGHLPSVEQPEQFNEALVEFLAQWR